VILGYSTSYPNKSKFIYRKIFEVLLLVKSKKLFYGTFKKKKKY